MKVHQPNEGNGPNERIRPNEEHLAKTMIKAETRHKPKPEPKTTTVETRQTIQGTPEKLNESTVACVLKNDSEEGSKSPSMDKKKETKKLAKEYQASQHSKT